MLYLVTGIVTRIISNSYLNVFQKILTNKGQKSSSINLYTYLGLCLISIWFFRTAPAEIIPIAAIMGLLGALGNFFIIKALSIGELSSIAPINSYKPVVALIIGFLYLHEIPTLSALAGISLIIFGTYLISEIKGALNRKAVFYRVLALIFSGTEAIFIKKIILMTDIATAFFLWAFSGLIFSSLLIRQKPVIKSVKYQLLLVLAVGIMQYSTNFVFARMNVAYALALFQLSTLLSVLLGANLFHESNLKQKLTASVIMILGAVILIILG